MLNFEAIKICPQISYLASLPLAHSSKIVKRMAKMDTKVYSIKFQVLEILKFDNVTRTFYIKKFEFWNVFWPNRFISGKLFLKRPNGIPAGFPSNMRHSMTKYMVVKPRHTTSRVE